MSSNVGVCFFQEDYAVEDVPDFDDDDFPFEGEFALSFLDKNPSSVPMGDYRFDKFACEAYNRAFGRNVKALYGEKDSVSAVDPDFCDALLYGGMEDDDMMDRLQCDDSHIGGYLYFTQSVPREYEAAYQNCDTVLLQIDTDDEIMWGDCGVANFFISAEDLAKRISPGCCTIGTAAEKRAFSRGCGRECRSRLAFVSKKRHGE